MAHASSRATAPPLRAPRRVSDPDAMHRARRSRRVRAALARAASLAFVSALILAAAGAPRGAAGHSASGEERWDGGDGIERSTASANEVAAAGWAATGRPAPSVLLIHADDLGYGDLGCTGHPTSVTPAIDRLAAEGVRFTQFYSASPVCSPSRAGLLTGRWPARVGVYCANETEQCERAEDSSYGGCCNGVWLPGMPGGVPTTEKTIATFLKSAGYRTIAVGKWHLGGVAEHHPSKYGFDEYFGCPHGVGACPPGPCFCPDEPCAIAGAANWTGCPVIANETIVTQPLDLRSLSARTVAAASDFVARAAASGSKFFVYYASHHVHSPQFAGADTTNTTLRGRFGDSLAELDASVGALMRAVALVNRSSSTLTLFTSDNGPSLRNEARGGDAGTLRCGKGTTWEGGSRVPLIAHWPGVTPPGVVAREVVASLDLLPTIAAVAGIAIPPLWALDGVGAVDVLLTGAGRSARDGAFVYFPQFAQRSRGLNGSGIYAARAGRWKAHWFVQGSLQCGVNNTDAACRPSQPYERLAEPLIFDIESDPGERYPLAPTDPLGAVGLAAAERVARAHVGSFQWWPGGPLLNAGPFDARLQPCCRPGCEPFPSCCRCDAPGHFPAKACEAGDRHGEL